MAFIDINQVQSWTYSSILGGINRIDSIVGIKWIKNTFNNEYNYKQNRNYQYVTSATGSGTIDLSFKFIAPFHDGIVKSDNLVSTDGGIEFYLYANPISNETSNTLLTYGADETFTNSVIQSSKLQELKFFINGFSEYKRFDDSIDVNPSGWSYNLSNNSYEWILSNSVSSKSPSYSIFGSGLNQVSNKNYIAKLIEYDTFNLELDYTKNSGDVDDNINAYLVKTSELNQPNKWKDIITLTQSTSLTGTYSIIGLDGTNVDGTKNYLVFSFDKTDLPGISRTNTFHSTLSNINTYGSYHPINNRQTIATTDEYFSENALIEINISGAAYSYSSLTNGQPYTLHSKIGNGFFKAGIWENGVWNNGWRDDTESRDFDEVALSILTASDVSWKIEIRGSTQSIENFGTGSVISIGNIVAIDINDNRKLLKDFYKVESVGTDLNYGWLRVNLDTTFPYRRIEKDSPNHKIKVTKNVWLSGGFFNGYFSGVWNNGLFKGYPLLTEMFDTHWIDGFFNGGHINSNYSKTWNFRAIGPRENCMSGYMNLTFFEKTSFLIGDYINITLITEVISFPKTAYSAMYNGVAKIVFIETVTIGNETYDIITIDKISIGNPTIGSATSPIDELYSNKIGSAIRHTATSLIQNFKFYDNNKSKLKSSDSNLSSAVFSFNSWIDMNYDDSRSVTLGRDFRAYEPLTNKSINRNNLYGYPTYDILSSSSRFRDSNTLNSKLYKLGTKYKVFTDFIGEYSEFNEPFDPALNNIKNFYDAGWKFSFKNTDIDFNRTESLISSNSVNNTLSQSYIDSGVTGDELYITSLNSGGVLNNSNIKLNKSRYSVVEFDVVTYSVATDYKYRNEQYVIAETGFGTQSSYVTQSNLDQVILTSSYEEIKQIKKGEIINISLCVSLSCGDLSKITINLKSPDNRVINIKKVNSGSGSTLVKTIFDYSSLNSMDTSFQPYTNKYKMDKQLTVGTTGYIANSNTISDLVVSNTSGIWTIYIQDDGVGNVVLNNWYLIIRYKEYIDEVVDTPVIDLPVLHFSNLNYEINTISSLGATGNSSLQIYKKMSYLPITKNINHLTSKNTFRLDSIEDATPDRWGGFGKNTLNKKYEYFYNKTDMMLNISGNGDGGMSQSMVVLDNLNVYEVDMIPFFKYFDDSNIYKGIQQPIRGTSPEIDYLNSDFIFIDNISIGLDSIEEDASIFIGCGDITLDDLLTNIKIIGITLEYNVTSYTMIQAINSGDAGSATCSTEFNSISWSISSILNEAIILNGNTLYPSFSNLHQDTSYSVSVQVFNGAQTSSSSMIIYVLPAPYIPPPVITIANSVIKSISFIPGEYASNRAKPLTYSDLVVSYYNSSIMPANPNPVSIKILSLPLQGSITFNGNLLNINSIIPINTTDPSYTTGTIIGNFDFYPEGLTQVINNSAFNTSFTYTVVDAQNAFSTIGTMNLLCTIPASFIIIPSPKAVLLNYNILSPLSSVYIFSSFDILDGYSNSNSLNPMSIKIINVPSRGQLSINGTIVSVNSIITVSDIASTKFKYHAQNINSGDVTGGDFISMFTYKVTDTTSNDSMIVTMNINCIDSSNEVTSLPPQLIFGNASYNALVGSTTNQITLKTGYLYSMYIKNNTNQNMLFGSFGYIQYDPAVTMTLISNSAIGPILSDHPFEGDILGPGEQILVTIDNSVGVYGNFVLTATTQIFDGSFINVQHNWYIRILTPIIGG